MVDRSPFICSRALLSQVSLLLVLWWSLMLLHSAGWLAGGSARMAEHQSPRSRRASLSPRGLWNSRAGLLTGAQGSQECKSRVCQAVAQAWVWHITTTTFYWWQQVTGPTHIQEEGTKGGHGPGGVAYWCSPSHYSTLF